jgi:hypothetical protein
LRRGRDASEVAGGVRRHAMKKNARQKAVCA